MASDARVRVVVVADSDSYLKWSVTRAGDLPGHWDTEVVVVRSKVTPSAAQIEAAVDHRIATPRVVGFRELVQWLREDPPDAVVLACRGPLLELLVRKTWRRDATRPVIASGIPGIWFPPTSRGLDFRRAADLMVVHAEAERDAVARTRPSADMRIGLASLWPAESPRRVRATQVVFAPQALVPRSLPERQLLLDALIDTARAHPDVDVVIKVRAVQGEAQTHLDTMAFTDLLEGRDQPANLVVRSGPLADFLPSAVGLVTVSSTAALEALAAEVPVLCLDDFGVREENINLVFRESGLLGGMDDLRALKFHHADASWAREHYFHAPESNDWVGALGVLVAERREAPLGYPRLSKRTLRARFKSAVDRSVALGGEDTRWRWFVGRLVTRMRKALRFAR